MRILLVIICLFLSVPVWAVSESNIIKLVEKAPEVKSEADLANLVKRLTQPLKEEEDKAYVLLTWIVKNIDYDEYKKNQIEDKTSSRHSRAEIPESGDILKTRLGVCADITNLYQRMLKQANMQAVVINGCTGEINKKTKKCKDKSPGHSWNAVWIKDQWVLVDPTWAITGKQTTALEDITKKRVYEKELKKREKRASKTYEVRSDRKVNKKWFMTSPKTMEQDHHPEDEKWLLTRPRDRKNKNL